MLCRSAYVVPVDGSRSEGQGLRISFDGGARVVLRLSGTGTEGATLRVYLEKVETDPATFGTDAQQALAPVIAAAEEIGNRHTHRTHRARRHHLTSGDSTWTRFAPSS